MDDTLLTPPKQERKNSYKRWIIAIVIIIGLTLPFHYIPEQGMVFPKDHLTFSNTFITQEDIDKLIERYNNSSFFERQAINQEPFVRKLMEKGIIVERDKSSEETED